MKKGIDVSFLVASFGPFYLLQAKRQSFWKGNVARGSGIGDRESATSMQVQRSTCIALTSLRRQRFWICKHLKIALVLPSFEDIGVEIMSE